MTMLLGEFRHNADAKGRVAIPSRFRDALATGAIITRGIDNCLFVFAQGEWQSLVEKLTALPISQSNSRAFVRLMLSGAMDVEIDKQGRILIPEYLRTYAGIEKEVVVTGLYSRIEVWSADRWHEYKEKTEHASQEIAEQLGALGI